MAIKDVRTVSCDEVGCTRSSPTDEIHPQVPYFHIKVEIIALDASGGTTVCQIDTYRCRWHYSNVLFDDAYDMVKANIEVRAQLALEPAVAADQSLEKQLKSIPKALENEASWDRVPQASEIESDEEE